MSRTSLWLVAAAVSACAAGSAWAGEGAMTKTDAITFSRDDAMNLTVTQQTAVTPQDNVKNNFHWLESWYIDAEGVGHMTLADNAQAEDLLSGDQHFYTQEVNGDPMSMLTTFEYNYSGVDWIAYDVSIGTSTPNVTVAFTGTPTSSGAWSDAVSSTATTIHFSGTATNTPLHAGDMATLTYTILITPQAGFTGGPITYCITTSPMAAPEPASLLLLAPAALGLLARRRR